MEEDVITSVDFLNSISDDDFSFEGDVNNSIEEVVIGDIVPDATIDPIVEETTEETTEGEEATEGEETNAEVADEEGSNLDTYIDFLSEQGIIDPLEDEDMEAFRAMPFEEQTVRLKEIQENTINIKAQNVFEEYIANKPEELKIIENNLANGLDIKDAIRFALEAPDVYDPISDSEINVEKEESLVYNDYFKKLGDANNARALTEIDKTSGLLTEKAKNISIKNAEAWTQAQEAMVQENDRQRAAEIENYNNIRADFAKHLSDTSEIIPGLKIDKNIRERIFKSFYEPKVTSNGTSTDINMKISANPKQYNALIGYLVGELDVLNHPENFEKIFKVGKTKQADIAKKSLKSGIGLTNKASGKHVVPKVRNNADYMVFN